MCKKFKTGGFEFFGLGFLFSAMSWKWAKMVKGLTWYQRGFQVKWVLCSHDIFYQFSGCWNWKFSLGVDEKVLQAILPRNVLCGRVKFEVEMPEFLNFLYCLFVIGGGSKSYLVENMALQICPFCTCFVVLCKQIKKCTWSGYFGLWVYNLDRVLQSCTWSFVLAVLLFGQQNLNFASGLSHDLSIPYSQIAGVIGFLVCLLGQKSFRECDILGSAESFSCLAPESNRNEWLECSSHYEAQGPIFLTQKWNLAWFLCVLPKGTRTFLKMFCPSVLGSAFWLSPRKQMTKGISQVTANLQLNWPWLSQFLCKQGKVSFQPLEIKTICARSAVHWSVNSFESTSQAL